MRLKPQIGLALIGIVVAGLLTGAAASPRAAASAIPTAGRQAPGSLDPAVRDLAARQRISVAQAATRLAWQGRAPALAAKAQAALGARFAGVWIDPADGDRLKVGVSSGALASDLTLGHQAAAAVGLQEASDVVPVRYSLRVLEAANAWLGSRLDAVNAHAAWGLGAQLRPSRNAVELIVPRHARLTAAERSLIREALRRFGSAVRVSYYDRKPAARACAFPYCDPPLRGGMAIFNSTGTVGCTSGFLARSRSDNLWYQFTAGHCVVDGGTGDWWSYFVTGGFSAHNIGPVHNYVLSNEGDYAILLVRASVWNPRAWVYVSTGPGHGTGGSTLNPEYRISSDNLSMDGQRVCTTGAFFDETNCGIVTGLNVTAPPYDGVTVHHLGRSNFCGTNGDSGAPVFAYSVAYGIQVAGFSECDSLYQGIRAAAAAMNVNVAHEG